MTPANERLLARIHSVREKIFGAIRELEDLGVGPKDVAPEDFNAIGEAIRLLKGMAQAYRQGDELPELVAAKMEEDLFKTEVIARLHIGRTVAHMARASVISAAGDPSEAGENSQALTKM